MLGESIARMASAAVDGAIGGAVCGAALGIISHVMLGGGGGGKQRRTVLPVPAPHIERNANILQSVSDVLACVPPSATTMAARVVQCVEELCRLHSEGAKQSKRNVALANRAFNTAKKGLELCAARGGSSAGIDAPAEELLEQCQDMLFNLCLD